MKILGIESSCDETGIAIYDSEAGLLADALHSQIPLHQTYGGVVPELASRDHIRRCIPLTEQVLRDSGLTLHDLDGIAYTKGPGLVGALLVGASYAKSLAASLGIPTLGVHHMEGHLLAPMLSTDAPAFPQIALLVSGGHTMLIEVQALGQYRLLGESLDDAAGEAFDKTAKILGLGYPGGPQLAAAAQSGEAGRFTFPRPMTNRPGLDFSFSGLKTFALNKVEELGLEGNNIADIAHAFQEAVVDTLFIKCKRAIAETGVKRLVIAGGVSANRRLRERLDALPDATVYYPEMAYCTDNGAMIAYAGCQRMLAGEKDPDEAISVRARWPIDSLNGLATEGQNV